MNEINKTEGGVAALNFSNNFGFSTKQIIGLTNTFDCDSVETTRLGF